MTNTLERGNKSLLLVTFCNIFLWFSVAMLITVNVGSLIDGTWVLVKGLILLQALMNAVIMSILHMILDALWNAPHIRVRRACTHCQDTEKQVY